MSLKFKTGSFLLKSLPFPNTLTLVCPQSPSLPGLKDQKGQRGYMQPCQPLENKHLNRQMKKKKKAYNLLGTVTTLLKKKHYNHSQTM